MAACQMKAHDKLNNVRRLRCHSPDVMEIEKDRLECHVHAPTWLGRVLTTKGSQEATLLHCQARPCIRKCEFGVNWAAKD